MLLSRKLPPEQVLWSAHPSLFDELSAEPAPALALPRSFVKAAQIVARHSSPERWSLLYRVAWRILNENRNLMVIEVDDDIRALERMRKAVQTDIYKTKAFVRFRRVVIDGIEQFIAWYAPDHDTLEANIGFFVQRFGGMRWSILSPKITISWDLKELHRGPGVPCSQAPAHDELEELFRTYYSAIYNPARLNLTAMKAQLPVRRWKDLPEAQAIAGLVRRSREKVESMAAAQGQAASDLIPAGASLEVLRGAVHQCRACELCARATQAVFGEGAREARVVLVGEQPGDEEDLSGRPFVGPAGQVLDAALVEAGLARSELYVTNAVKAFRFEQRGKRRIHKTPRGAHIATCRPWLEAEISAIQPSVIVCLGASAAQSVFGRTMGITGTRGQFFAHPWAESVTVTYHPSAILRNPDQNAQQQLTRALIEDLSAVRARANAAADSVQYVNEPTRAPDAGAPFSSET